MVEELDAYLTEQVQKSRVARRFSTVPANSNVAGTTDADASIQRSTLAGAEAVDKQPLSQGSAGDHLPVHFINTAVRPKMVILCDAILIHG
jgi:hypothetical protein